MMLVEAMRLAWGASAGINMPIPSLILSIYPSSFSFHFILLEPSTVLLLWSVMALTRYQLVKNSRHLRLGRLTARHTSKVSQLWCVRKLSPLSSPASKPSKNASPSGRSRQSNLSLPVLCVSREPSVAALIKQVCLSYRHHIATINKRKGTIDITVLAYLGVIQTHQPQTPQCCRHRRFTHLPWVRQKAVRVPQSKDKKFRMRLST